MHIKDTTTRFSSSSTSNEASASQDDLKDETKRMSSISLGEKAKKKNWYNVIYPTYKSRTEDFKKLFTISEDERLLVGKHLLESDS